MRRSLHNSRSWERRSPRFAAHNVAVRRATASVSPTHTSRHATGNCRSASALFNNSRSEEETWSNDSAIWGPTADRTA